MMRQSVSLSHLAALSTLLFTPTFILAQEGFTVQRNPIVTEARHTTTTVAFRDMVDVGWHNVSKVMPEHDRALHPHVSSLPDAAAQELALPPVSANTILNFDGITDAQGGGFVPPDTNASVGSTQVVETVNVAYSVWDKATGTQLMAPKSIQTLYTSLGDSARLATSATRS